MRLQTEEGILHIRHSIYLANTVFEETRTLSLKAQIKFMLACEMEERKR